MFGVKAQITKCLEDTGYPSFVECQFTDAHGNTQIFNDKDAIFTAESLSKASDYPIDGIIGCVIIERNSSIVKVNTESPWYIESTKGETIFEVLQEQLVEFERLV